MSAAYQHLESRPWSRWQRLDETRLAMKPGVRLCAGVHYDSSTEKYQIGVTARKNFQLGNSETWLKVSQDALYDPKTQKVTCCSAPTLESSVECIAAVATHE